MAAHEARMARQWQGLTQYQQRLLAATYDALDGVQEGESIPRKGERY